MQPCIFCVLLGFFLLPVSFCSVTHRRHLQPLPLWTNSPSTDGSASETVHWTVEAKDMCSRQQKKRNPRKQQCNLHNKQFRCSCVLSTSRNHTSHSCQSVLPRVERPEEQLLTFGINFPLIEQFKEQPERVFLEDMEIFTFIPREAIVIYRRGCSPDRSAYEFQIGILESTCQHVKPRLRTLSPRIFLSNRFFMQENALKIGYIQAG